MHIRGVRLSRYKRYRAMPVIAAALSAGAVSAVLVGTTSAATTTPTVPTSVLFGTTSVPVPADGTITLAGQLVQVLPGAQRIFLITPPAGSETSSDGTGTSLPAGATGEAFAFPSATSTATTVQATAVAGSAVTPDATQLGCELSASRPSQLAGIKQVQGVGIVNNAPGYSCSSVIKNSLTTTLYGGDIKRGSGSTTFNGTGSRRVQTACTTKNQNWHTRADLESLDTENGDEESGYENSPHPDPLITC